MKGNVAPVYCEFKYSGVGVGLLGFACVSTALIVSLTPLDIALRTALIALIVPMTLLAIRRLRAVRALRLDGARTLQVTFEGRGEVTGQVRDGSFVAPWLTVIRWRPDGRWFDRMLLVLPGMLGASEFRRLRVLLRWS